MSRMFRAALAMGASIAVLPSGISAHADEGRSHTVAASSTVQFEVAHSGKCLTIENGSFRDNASALQSKCTDGLTHQQFELTPTGSATFDVQAKHSGKCLYYRDEAGSDVEQTSCYDIPYTTFPWKIVLVEVADELYELRTASHPNYCLDIRNASREDGAKAQVWYCNGTNAQRWRLHTIKT